MTVSDLLEFAGPERLLHVVATGPTEAPTSSPTVTFSPTTEAEGIVGNDSEVLRNTLRIYGSLFLVLFIVFCSVRRKYPGAYNVRSYNEDLKTDLADNQFGFISWMWKLFFISDNEFLNECGMDSLCFVRVLEFGLKLTLVGMCNALWLMPVYGYVRAGWERRGRGEAIPLLRSVVAFSVDGINSILVSSLLHSSLFMFRSVLSQAFVLYKYMCIYMYMYMYIHAVHFATLCHPLPYSNLALFRLDRPKQKPNGHRVVLSLHSLPSLPSTPWNYIIHLQHCGRFRGNG